MCPSTQDLKSRAEWDGAAGESRYHLLSELSSELACNEIIESLLTKQECISPSVMLPEHRLAVLLHQVKRHQISNCLYHNTASSPSLYQDHMCDRSNFPVTAVVQLDRHGGEVWDVQFSHDGTRLASCGGDGMIVIYDMATFEVLQSLAGSEAGVCSISWSPDDTMIVTCSQDKRARLWNSHVSGIM